MLRNPMGVAVDAKGNLFIADTGNNRIREVDVNGIITTVAGGGNSGLGDGGAATNAVLTPWGQWHQRLFRRWRAGRQCLHEFSHWRGRG